jgi:TP901 family phage tail tape measure protein
VADLLAAGAGKAQGSVEDMGMALKQGGLLAASTGLSIEETTGTLAAFASAGLIGSDAGTSFKTMLQSLTPVSVAAKNEMDRLASAPTTLTATSSWHGSLPGCSSTSCPD